MATYTGKDDSGITTIIRVYAGRGWRKDRLVAAIKAGIVTSLNEMKADYESTTATWKHRPQFKVMPRKLAVSHNSKKYNWLDFGARRYVRVDRNFVAKTTTGWIGSRAGAGDLIRKSTGGPVKFRPYHAVGRGWSIAIVEKQIRTGALANNIRRGVMSNLDRIFPPLARPPG